MCVPGPPSHRWKANPVILEPPAWACPRPMFTLREHAHLEDCTDAPNVCTTKGCPVPGCRLCWGPRWLFPHELAGFRVVIVG